MCRFSSWPVLSRSSPDQSPGFAFRPVKPAGSPAWRCIAPGPPLPGSAVPDQPLVPGFAFSPWPRPVTPQDFGQPGLDFSLGVPTPQSGPSSDLGCEACRLAGLALPTGLLRPLLVTEDCPFWRSRESVRTPPPLLHLAVSKSCPPARSQALAPHPTCSSCSPHPSPTVACAPVSCTRPAWPSRTTGGQETLTWSQHPHLCASALPALQGVAFLTGTCVPFRLLDALPSAFLLAHPTCHPVGLRASHHCGALSPSLHFLGHHTGHAAVTSCPPASFLPQQVRTL